VLGNERVGTLVGSSEGAYVKPDTVGVSVEGSLEGRLVLGLELLGEEVTGDSDIGALVGSSEGV
jgi:hypothetical protein